MAASYPTSVKTFATKASADTIQPAHVNDLQDEVTAIETALLTSGLAHALKITAGAGAAALTLPTTGRLYLDGGTNTYLSERASDTFNIVAGGTSMVDINATEMYVYGGLVVSGAVYIGNVLTSFGENNSGGTGYRLVRVPNA